MRRTTAATLTTMTALVAVLPVLAGVPSASAESVSVPDAVGDVSDGRWRASYDQDLADVRRSTLDHQRKRVALRLAMVEVKKRGDWAMAAEGRLRLPDGSERWMVLEVDGSGQKTVELQDSSREPLACDGVSGGLRPGADVVVVSVPRSCLGDPAWVRYGAGVTVSWGRVSSRDDARSDEGFSLPQDFRRRVGPEKIRPRTIG